MRFAVPTSANPSKWATKIPSTSQSLLSRPSAMKVCSRENVPAIGDFDTNQAQKWSRT